MSKRSSGGGLPPQAAASLLVWFNKHGRQFPWRKRRTSPFRVLIAEVLLRRTTSKKVLAVFGALTKAYPTTKALADARPERLEVVLRPLGLQRVRSKTLQALGVTLEREFKGRIPERPSELAALPGVGKYIANAVACFAYGKRTLLLDSPISRVLSRVLGVRIVPDKLDPVLERRVMQAIPHQSVAEIYWAILDLASAICRPGVPICPICPIKSHCSYFSTSAFQMSGAELRSSARLTASRATTTLTSRDGRTRSRRA
jgi:A/G-specific adenine glycosylase